MEKISIIVPIYNVKTYLNNCLNSIINQTYNNLEIILIDDGSTDGSKEIIDKYQKKDNRIKSLHQKNQGLSIARNVGISLATGEYLSFIDSDDYIEKDFIELLYNNIIKYNAKMSVCSYFNSKNFNNKSKETIQLLNSSKSIEKFIMCDGKYGVVTWNKLYKKELFENNKFPNGKNYEDIYPIINAALKAKEIVFSNQKKYHYNDVRSESISNDYFNVKEFDRLENIQKVKEIIKPYPNLNNLFNIYEILNRLYICDKLIRLNKINDNFVIETKLIIKKNVFNIIMSKYKLRRKLQLLYFAFLTSKYQISYYRHIKIESNKLVSVIVPIYNSEKYLDRCLKSIINQSHQNLEIILMNDGSTDSSIKIINKYANKDKRIKVINQEKKYLSIIRNDAIKIASGDYISFIDSDDFIDKNFIEDLLSNLIITNLSVACCSYNFGLNIKHTNKQIKILSSEKAINKMINFNTSIGLGCTNKLYKKECFNQNKFPNNISCNEDLFIIGKIFDESKRIVINYNPYYHYIKRKDSLSNEINKDDYKRMILINDLNKLIENKYPKLINTMKIYKIIHYIGIYNKLLISNINDNDLIKSIKVEIKKNIFIIFFTKYNLIRKCEIYIFLLNIKLYKFIYKKFYENAYFDIVEK